MTEEEYRELRFNEVDDGCKENICKLLGFWKEPNFDDDSGRYEHCPLRPLPEKKEVYYTQGSYNFDPPIPKSFLEMVAYEGYNACLDEILGEIK